MKVAVVGIGRIGLPLAVALSKQYETLGIDVDARAVQRVNSRAGFAEPQVDEYLRQYGLRAGTDFAALDTCKVVFVCVGSQTPGKGYSSDRFLSALGQTLPHLKAKDQLLVITTTLPPLELKEAVIPMLERDRIEEKIVGYCYNPAMVALGKAVSDFESPKYMMIGESSEEAGAQLEATWRKVIGPQVSVFHGKPSDVAVAKYALNVALVLKISLLSFLTELCEKEGSDVDKVTQILQAEPRVAGPKMFKGGMGYGGTCFPVDIEAARYECERLGIPTSFPDAITKLNDWQVERSIDLISSFGKKKVAVLGLSFKQDTDVVAASQSLQVARGLAGRSYNVVVFDPKGMGNAKAVLGDSVTYASTAKEAVDSAEVVFLGVEWPEFTKLRGSSFRKEQVVVDPWRILRSDPPPGTYVPYGLGRSG
jgi:UDPglucose 6-dehydrogenase